MLELQHLTVTVGGEGGPTLLREITARFPRGQLCALIGPSGSGKTTLIRTVAGMSEPTEGSVRWDRRNMEEEDLPPSQIGYVPQFTISDDNLTAAENVRLALQLRVDGLDNDALVLRANELLELTGLAPAARTMGKHLSGGQRRRLALAMELCSEPALLLCDEVTSGLDAQSEKEILALLQRIARKGHQVVIVVTHGLGEIDAYDKVAVLSDGHLAYFGPPETAAHYFRAEKPEEIFERLPQRSGADWHASWGKHRGHFEQDAEAAEATAPREKTMGASGVKARETAEPGDDGAAPQYGSHPSPMRQLMVLLAVRWKVFFRNRGGLALHMGLLLGFPLVVAIFASKGLPAVPALDADLSGDVVRQLVEARTFAEGASRAGSMVSGLVLLQVILLGLMGANNSAREIAGERRIYEKERFAGLSAGAYVASKVAFLGVIVLLQSAWMTWFVRTVADFPGDASQQFIFYLMANASMTAVCLGISAAASGADQASLASIYLVGFQLPLSGAVLALPSGLDAALRPFIAAYWSWSGALQSLRETRYYDVLELVIPTSLSAASLCLWILLLHVAAGIFAAWLGCLRAAREG
jgi:ABC-type multidrug transport system ATPase subunit